MPQLPNLLSLLRLACVPVLVVLANQEREGAFFGLVVAAWATDGLDGWLARRFGWVSRLGAVLDSVADVSLIVAILYGVWSFHPIVYTDHGAFLWAIVVVWTGVHLASLVRYGRTSSFHTRLAQAGILLFAAFVLVLFTKGFVPVLYYVAGSVCLLAGFENAAMVWALETWQPDVPSLAVALRRRAESRKSGLPRSASND
ncbi:MAG: CDP-alcohol phosphatidyltransferase family protein [bacterium]|nr:CDP-alcohol phosphatidyltransferase family protein [bacterium]